MEQTIELKSAVADLNVFIANLSDYDQSFASSLISQYKTKGFLSDKQTPYVFKLLQKAIGTVEPAAPMSLEVGRILTMFNKAKQKLKLPKVVFKTNFGVVRMWIQGKAAKYPGSVAITLDKLWMGRVHTDGKFQTGVNFQTFDGREKFVDLMVAFSKNPEEVASHYGKLHSKCIFCMKGLNDPKSLAMGYGPICADTYGLDWGSVKLTTAGVLQ